MFVLLKRMRSHIHSIKQRSSHMCVSLIGFCIVDRSKGYANVYSDHWNGSKCIQHKLLLFVFSNAIRIQVVHS